MRHPAIGGRAALILAAAAGLLSACAAVGPDFAAPESAWAPAHWFTTTRPAPPAQASVPDADAAPPAQWWSVLNDPVLTGLEARLPVGNLDLRAAGLRLAEARAALGVAEAARVSAVNASAGATRNQQSHEGALRLTNAQRTPLGTSYDLYQYGFDASWEIDLWGRVRRGVEQAAAQADAAAEAMHGVAVTASAELARDYLQLRGIQAKLGITRENLQSARASLDLTRARAEGGLTNDLDVANAATLVASVEAEIPALERQRDTLKNAIALLLGEPPGALEAVLAPPRALPPPPPRVPVGVPGDLVRRRPDIREAEATLHAATAATGVATADFYPRLTLAGSGMIQGLQMRNLADLAAQAYNFGPSITLPIFDGGRLTRTLALREAQQQEAAILWRARFLGALHEVDDALTAYASEQQRHDRLAAAAASARRALGLARARYTQGVADFLQVLTAQRAQLAAEQDLADSSTTLGTDLVQLYKALGGGWDL